MIATDTPIGTTVYYLKKAGPLSWYERGVVRSHGRLTQDFVVEAGGAIVPILRPLCVFVRFDGTTHAMSCKADDLFLEQDVPDGAQCRNPNCWYLKGDLDVARA